MRETVHQGRRPLVVVNSLAQISTHPRKFDLTEFLERALTRNHAVRPGRRRQGGAPNARKYGEQRDHSLPS
jgi:hypothetical protein